MKNNLMTLIARIVAAAAVVVIFAFASPGQGRIIKSPPPFEQSGKELVGTWDAVVTIRDCNSGAALNTFASIASFNQGGTSIGSTSGIPQANRTPEHGVWRHVRGHTYEFSFKSFSFVGGVPSGYTIVTHTLDLDRDGDTYTSAGTARIHAPSGIQVGQGCSDAVGTRFGF